MGMPVWRVNESQADYRLFDTPLRYVPAYGPPVSLDMVYQTWRPTDYEYYPRNDLSPLFGAQWHCVWSADLALAENGLTFLNLHGARLIYTFDGDPDLSEPQAHDGSRVEILRDGWNNAIGGKVHKRDGTVREFSEAASATRFLLTSLTDGHGHTLEFSYDGYGRLEEITDAAGGTTSFVYGDLDGDMDASNDRVVTEVNAPAGYTATFNYEQLAEGRWYLTNITDTVGISSTFTYREYEVTVITPQSYWALETMNTPYGTTQFEHLGEEVFWDFYLSVITTDYGVTLLITEPNGGQHLYLQNDQAPEEVPVPATFSASVIPTNLPISTLDTNRQGRNTFYWGPLQLANIGNVDVENWDWDEFKRARIRHWLWHHDEWDTGHKHMSDVLAWEQSPSPDGTAEGQVTWYDYAGKDPQHGHYPKMVGTGTKMPAVVARVLPDGSTWYQYFAHNDLGRPTLKVETYSQPGGGIGTRTNRLFYAANGIDLELHLGPQGEQVVSNYFGNAYHQVDASDDALDQETRFTYNGSRQLTSIQRPSGLTTTNFYFSGGGAAGRLEKTIDLEINRENAYTYYTDGQVYTHTDERGLVTTNFWDRLRRLTGVLYSDGTTRSNVYAALSLAGAKDRLDQWTTYGYNGIGQTVAVTNANGVVTRNGYCECGSLLSTTNAWNTAVEFVTQFGYDNQGNRKYTIYPDATVTNWFDSLRRTIVTGDAWGYRWFYYNNQGLLTNVSNAYGIEQSTVFDLDVRLVFSAEHDLRELQRGLCRFPTRALHAYLHRLPSRPME